MDDTSKASHGQPSASSAGHMGPPRLPVAKATRADGTPAVSPQRSRPGQPGASTDAVTAKCSAAAEATRAKYGGPEDPFMPRPPPKNPTWSSPSGFQQTDDVLFVTLDDTSAAHVRLAEAQAKIVDKPDGSEKENVKRVWAAMPSLDLAQSDTSRPGQTEAIVPATPQSIADSDAHSMISRSRTPSPSRPEQSVAPPFSIKPGVPFSQRSSTIWPTQI
jgi:hypothetical protein